MYTSTHVHMYTITYLHQLTACIPSCTKRPVHQYTSTPVHLYTSKYLHQYIFTPADILSPQLYQEAWIRMLAVGLALLVQYICLR